MKEFDKKKYSKNIEKKLRSNLSRDEIINRAFQYHLAGNIPEASKYYQFFINQGFKDHRIFSNYVLILKGFGKLKEAEITTRKAIELNPNYALGHSNLGGILNSLGKLKEAELSTRKAIKLNPEYANAYYNLGNILRDLKKLSEAAISLKKTIKLKPNFFEAHRDLGICLYLLKDIN